MACQLTSELLKRSRASKTKVVLMKEEVLEPDFQARRCESKVDRSGSVIARLITSPT